MAYYFGNALADIKGIKGTADGHLDISSLPVMAQKSIQKKLLDEKGVPVLDAEKNPVIFNEPGRDIGMMTSILTKAVQQLTERLENLEKK